MKAFRIVALTLVLSMLLTASLAGAQGDFRATFDLPLAAEEGEFVGLELDGTVVEYWHQHSGDREEELNEMVAEFNEGNPWGITIEASNQGGYGDIYQKFIAGIASGELPGLVVAYQNQSATYQLDEALVDLDLYVNDPVFGLNEAEVADFFQGFYMQDLSPQFDFMRIGFPPNRSMEVMYMNLDALAEIGYEAAPTTWEEFGEMACAWTESAEGRNGYSVRTDASFIAASTFALGSDIFDYENDEYVYNNEETVYALSFLADLIDQGCANMIAERYADQNDFGAQTNLFTVGSSSGLPYYRSAIAESEAGSFEWDVFPLPWGDFDAEGPTQNVYGASVTVPVTTDEQQLAAWLFIRWFTEAEQQARWAEASNYFPVRESVAENMSDYFENNPQYESAFSYLDSTHAEPPVAGYDVVRDMAEESFFDILDGADAQDTLDQLTDNVNEVYQTQFQP